MENINMRCQFRFQAIHLLINFLWRNCYKLKRWVQLEYNLVRCLLPWDKATQTSMYYLDIFIMILNWLVRIEFCCGYTLDDVSLLVFFFFFWNCTVIILIDHELLNFTSFTCQTGIYVEQSACIKPSKFLFYICF